MQGIALKWVPFRIRQVAGSPQRMLSVEVARQVEAADLAAQSAAVAVLKALPELQLMLKDFGSANRDGCACAAS